MRTVILHYHLFKNAGTSLDAALKENFSEEKGEWVTKEFPVQPAKNREQLKQWLIDNPQAKCFSSHTAILPVPVIEGVKIIPVIFMRHPIDRMVSAYSFESKQGGDGFGAVLARNTVLSGYIETRLALGHDRQCRDFHAHRFAAMFGEKQGDEATRAKMAVKQLPFVGLVALFSESLEQLENLLTEEGFEAIKLKPVEKNVSRRVSQSLEEKLAEIKEQLGEEVYGRLIGANEVDLLLYKMVLSHYK